MRRVIIIVIMVMISMRMNSAAHASSFAEIEANLGQAIDPLMKYMQCEQSDPYQKIICSMISAEINSQLQSAGITLSKDGVIYTLSDFAPIQTTNISNCDDVSVTDSNADILVSRDTTFKLKFESLSKPLLFLAKVPSSINATVYMEESRGVWVMSPRPCGGYFLPNCFDRCEYPLSPDYFNCNANAVSTAYIAIALSLEARLLPRQTLNEDYRVEIAPRVIVDGYLEDAHLYYDIAGRDWITDTIMRLLSGPADLSQIANEFTHFNINVMKDNIIAFTIDTVVYPATSAVLDPQLFGTTTENLITRLVEERLKKEYQNQLTVVENKINAELVRTLNLKDGKYIFTIRKRDVDAALSSILVPIYDILL